MPVLFAASKSAVASPIKTHLLIFIFEWIMKFLIIDVFDLGDPKIAEK